MVESYDYELEGGGLNWSDPTQCQWPLGYYLTLQTGLQELYVTRVSHGTSNGGSFYFREKKNSQRENETGLITCVQVLSTMLWCVCTDKVDTYWQGVI